MAGKNKLLYVMVVGAVLLLLTAIALVRLLFATGDIPDGRLVGDAKRPARRTQSQVIGETLIELQEHETDVIRPPKQPKQSAPLTPATAEALAQVPVGKDIGRVVLLRGRAFAVNPSGKRRPLFQGAPVFLDEQIETVADSRLGIRLADGTELSQGASSSLVLDTFVYNPEKPDESGLSMRLIKGISRMITGKLVDLNPDAFKVRTRMATVGIRGCELVFDSNKDEDAVYVLSLSGVREVSVLTTRDGTPMMNMLTGDMLKVDDEKMQEFVINTPRSRVTTKRGSGARLGTISRELEDELQRATSHLAPAGYRLQQLPGGAQIEIQPAVRATQATGERS